jgi:hypothetical protein
MLRWEAMGNHLHKMSDTKGVELPTSHSAVLVGWDAIKPPPAAAPKDNGAKEANDGDKELDGKYAAATAVATEGDDAKKINE